MSNNLSGSTNFDLWLKRLSKQDFKKNSIVLIGTGMIAQQYGLALNNMKIKNVQVISNSKIKGEKFCQQFGFSNLLYGGYEKNLDNVENADLVIVSLPIHLLSKSIKKLLTKNFENLLVEKPGSLYASELLQLSKLIKNQNVRIGYNRLLYPSFLKFQSILKKEKITSCHFDFTEWIHKIIFNKYSPDVYQRWGISNSLHLISMAFELIGMPKKISCNKTGRLTWHKSGSVFTGSGISQNDIPFSYHADWGSSGRWGIEIMTDKRKYRLSPLEELSYCEKGEITWKKIPLTIPYPKSKAGISEEIACMLSKDENMKQYLPSLKKAASFNKIASKIFGYD